MHPALRYCRLSYLFRGMSVEVAEVRKFGWRYMHHDDFGTVQTKSSIKDRTDMMATLLEGFPRLYNL